MSLHLRPKRVSQYGLVAEYRFDQRNLLKYSEDFSNALWTKISTNIINTNNIAPDGTLTASNVQIQTPNFGSIFINIPVISGATYTLSFYAKDVNALNAHYRVYNVTNAVDLFRESYLETINKTSWKRIVRTFTVPVTCSNIYLYLLNGDTNVDLYLWGAQLELGKTATTYQKTTDLQLLQDYGRYGYHGQLGSTSGVDATDPIFDGQGLKFDGTDDFVFVGNIGKQIFALQCAFYVGNIINKDSAGQTLINAKSVPGEYVALGSYTGLLTNEIISVGDSSGGRNGWCSDTESISIGWHLLECIWDGVKYRIRLDNIEKSTTTIGTPQILFADNLLMGKLVNNTTYFSGKLSLLTFYNRSPIDAELANNRAIIKTELKMRGVDVLW